MASGLAGRLVAAFVAALDEGNVPAVREMVQREANLATHQHEVSKAFHFIVFPLFFG